jgi:C_GCAxxG_C_C family probable redox protein
MEGPDIRKQAVKGFIKVFSCAHSMLMVSADQYRKPVEVNMLKAVTGFGAGVATMGDVCGMVNGGVVALGNLLAPLYGSPEEEWKTAWFCHEFYRQTKEAAGTCSCGEIHGGKHLAKNFRKAILTGKTFKCFEMLYKGSGILDDFFAGIPYSPPFFETEKAARVRTYYEYFRENRFHCCRSTLQDIEERSGRDLSFLQEASTGFIGGIGFSGTLCGAVIGGVLAAGATHGVNPRTSDYGDTLKIIYHGLLKSDKIWSDPRVFKAAKAFDVSQKIYEMVESTYGNCACRTISGLDSERPETLQTYKEKNGITACRALADRIARETTALL